MTFIFPLAVGLVIGFSAAWLWLRERARAEASRLATQVEERDRQLQQLHQAIADRDASLRAAAQERIELESRLARTGAELDAARTQAQEKLALLEEARAKLEETFKALAGETLKANSESFMNLARSHLESLVAREDGNLEKRRESIEKLIAPIAESLRRYEEELRSLEKARQEAYAALLQQVQSLTDGEKQLRMETANLVNALRLPQVRGRWGELTLRRAVELAGMVEHCDFNEQVSVDTPDGRLRPDMVIRLPADREIVVDSKVSLSAYLEALEATDAEERRRKLEQHAAQVRAHMDRLASKEYARQFQKAPEFTILFVPGEPFLAAAAQHDPQLIEDGFKRGVVPASPATLIALLRAVAHGWRQASLEENARRISDAGREIYDKLGVAFRHLGELGAALKRALDCYNRAIASINSRLLPSARKLKELGATSAADIERLEPIQGEPQQLELPKGSHAEET